MTESFAVNFAIAAPEVFLAVATMGLLVAGVIMGDKSARLITWLALATLAGYAALALAGLANGAGAAFSGALVADRFAVFAKVVIAIGAGLTLLLSDSFMQKEKLSRFEFPVLGLLAVLGMGMMVSAGDIIAVYMGIELQSLALYVMAAFNRDSLRSSEAGLKYFVLGALSSGLLLYGLSLIFGATGATDFDSIAAALAQEESLMFTIGLVFAISGLAFKVSAAPFHMWTPDVYEGAPTPVTAFLAAAPKFAAMALFARVLVGPFGEFIGDWQQVIVALAGISIGVGVFGALAQSNIKRLMAYSSIANMGYALMGLAAGTQNGVNGLLIYMTIYLLSVIGVFACILAMRRKDGMVEQIDDLAGLSQTNPGIAVALSMLMLSVAGLPPFAGFIAKLYVFMAALDAGLVLLAVFAALGTVVGAFYYLRIVKLIWFDEPAQGFVRPGRTVAYTAFGSAALAFPILVVFIFPLISQAGAAASALFS
ncbi:MULTISPECIES: NADH-quinone oxidoreductase subunit NuoN [Euryhalocaulis]|uniref:NADH-quinone oxidoreductase subunit NuoN n=1 Tax=Euryhalocaulis TaxID=1712422 RepID=UPI00039CB413|nr:MULTISPECIES: NADH-quinone oxidoreductase subunit NuoN [Euryhalocaulis]MBA4800401.1 NADH-quinone oxidoreductase subunit NuoN [Euryhalocaulis sp.]